MINVFFAGQVKCHQDLSSFSVIYRTTRRCEMFSVSSGSAELAQIISYLDSSKVLRERDGSPLEHDQEFKDFISYISSTKHLQKDGSDLPVMFLHTASPSNCQFRIHLFQPCFPAAFW